MNHAFGTTGWHGWLHSFESGWCRHFVNVEAVGVSLAEGLWRGWPGLLRKFQVFKMLTKVIFGFVLVTLVHGDCKIRLVTDCDDLCSVSLQSPRVQVVQFSGRVASFGCVSLLSTWVCKQTNISFQYLITETMISELNWINRGIAETEIFQYVWLPTKIC
jgi:hypothetical protein